MKSYIDLKVAAQRVLDLIDADGMYSNESDVISLRKILGHGLTETDQKILKLNKPHKYYFIFYEEQFIYKGFSNTKKENKNILSDSIHPLLVPEKICDMSKKECPEKLCSIKLNTWKEITKEEFKQAEKLYNVIRA
jgi:hypothetical protein